MSPMPRSAADPFDALGDANRRAILALLGTHERSVQQLADALPISRPAVSRHLRVLKDAGLVTDAAVSTRRIYKINPEAFGSLRAYFDDFWSVALDAFKQRAESRRPKRRSSA